MHRAQSLALQGTLHYSGDIKYSSFMFYITATNEATEQQTEYTVIVDNTKSNTNANNPATYLAVLDDEQKVPLSTDLEITDMDGNGSKSFGEITTDIGLISVQVERKSEKVKNESKWMAADLNYVSLNGGTPIQFDTRRAGSPDTTSQALALERGINILQASCRMDTPDMKAFTSSNSASCGLKISTTVEKEAHAYQKFIFIINYTGSKPDIISDTQTSTAIKGITVSQYTSNTSVAQNDYIGITSSGGTSHKIVVPTTLHQWPSYKNSAPDKSLEDIKHETVILGIHTADPAATVKIVDAPYTAANGKIISMIDTNTTDKTLSYGPYWAVNLWNRDSLQVEVTACDGTKSTHTITVVRASSESDMLSLQVTEGAGITPEFSADCHNYQLNGDSVFSAVIPANATMTLNGTAVPDPSSISMLAANPINQLIVTAEDGVTQTVYTSCLRKTDYLRLVSRQRIWQSRCSIRGGMSARAKRSWICRQVTGRYSKPVPQLIQLSRTTRRLLCARWMGGNLYDVRKHTFKQATDYAAVIPELLMLGQNPYDFDGVNYVEGLLKEAVNQSFGGWANNIWALMALKAAGETIPDWLISTVKAQAQSDDFDLDMRGCALAAVSPWLTSAEKAAIATQLHALLIHEGSDTDMFSNPMLNSLMSPE